MSHILDKVIAQFKELGVEDPWGEDPEGLGRHLASRYSDEVLDALDGVMGDLAVHLFRIHKVITETLVGPTTSPFANAFDAVPQIVSTGPTALSKEFIHTWHTILTRMHKVSPMPLDSPESFYVWLSDNMAATDKIVFILHTSAMSSTEMLSWLKEIACTPTQGKASLLVN